MLEFLGMPELASAHGAELDRLMSYVHWLMAVLFVGWLAFFVFLLVRFNRRRNPRASYTGPKTKASSYVEGGVALAEAVLLVGFSIPLWYDRVDAFPSPEEDAVEVRVVGEQFAWNVHYPGPDGVFGRTDAALVNQQTNPLGIDRSDPAAEDDVTAVNQLRLPVDRPAIVHLSSKDVIHSFMLNEFRVKQDAIPGMDVPAHFTPTVTTAEMRERKGDPSFNYEIACAQLCGLGHYRMRGFVTIETQEEFDRWLAERARPEDEDSGGFWN
ncbi:MAG: cytochrome c oxidase subunit II [Thermoanaerobaculia bacterium]